MAEHWTKAEDDTLRCRRAAGESFATIARDLGRSTDAAYARHYILTGTRFPSRERDYDGSMIFDSQPFSVDRRRERVSTITIDGCRHEFQIYLTLLPGHRYVINTRDGRSFLRALRVGEEIG